MRPAERRGRPRSAARRALVLAAAGAVLVTGCGGATVATSTSTPKPHGSARAEPPVPTDALAEKAAQLDGVQMRWKVFGLYRHDGLVTLEFGVTSQSADPLSLGKALSKDPSGSEAAEDVSGVTLRDDAGKRRYSPASYAGRCRCSTGLGTIDNGQTMYLDASYKAPPAGVDELDVSIPAVGTFENVQVGNAPAERAAYPSPAALPKAVGSRVIQAAVPAGSADFPTPSKTYYVASLYGVYRKGDAVTVQVGLSLDGEVGYEAATDADLLGSDIAASVVDGISLVDAQRGRVHAVARNTDDECLCSPTAPVGAYSTTVLTATFAAPPAGTKEIDVVLSRFGMLPDVPITNGNPAKPDAPQPLPSSTYPNVVNVKQSGSGAVATAPVAEIKAPVYKAG